MLKSEVWKFQLECPIKTATKSISSTRPDLMGMADEEVGGRRDDWLLITFIQNDWLHGYKNKLSILCFMILDYVPLDNLTG